MAKKTVTTLIDDLDGSEAASTVAFAFGGRSYEIDLSDANRAALEEAIAPYVTAARRTGVPSRPGSRRARSTGPGSAADVRAWAAAHGHDVPACGRIPAAVRDAYDKAH